MDKILACLSPSPSNPKILQAAADMAGDRAELIALFVETPQFPRLADADRQRLQKNIQTAEQLGAKIQTVSGDDVAFQLAEYARLSGIRKIVLGQSDFGLSVLPTQASLPDRLAEYLPDAEIHVIPDRKRNLYFPPRREIVSRRRIGVDTAVTLLMLTAATLLGMLLFRMQLSNSGIMMLYLLGVLLVAITTSHRAYSIAASVASLFLFNFFFVQPRFSLVAYEPGYPVSFLVMFLTAVIAGNLANRLKQTASQAARTSFRARIISDTDQLLAKAESREEILRVCAEQSAKLLGCGVILYEASKGSAEFFCTVPEEGTPPPEEGEILTEKLLHGQPDGRSYPVHVQEKLYAVLQLAKHEPPPGPPTQSTLLSVLGECALALENEKNAREKKEAAVLAENERLRANLLRSISHDLRTPLMSITGNAGALLANEKRYPEETLRRIYSDIYEDSLWLTDLVENLLASTRLEGGAANLRLSGELLEDIFAEASAHIRADSGHTISIEPPEELLMVHADSKLIVQVLGNLIGNALKYTPPGSTVRLSARREGEMAVISVADDGPGISTEEKDKVFDMFFVGSNAASAGRRSLGLGLALCRTIVNTHGGRIWVEDNSPHGAVFSFTLPAEEVSEHG
ncbi:MAG: DUF4118 domain-containing protein [Oscillospiraceae bacterium]|nr:DUF4118 domain-containing protein [Oscillospiraceae bacterium]